MTQKALELPALHVGSGYRHQSLTWFPVWTDRPIGQRSYQTNADLLEIGELDREQVPTLRVRNRSDDPVVVFEGSVFEGGLQTRTLTRTSLIPAAAETEVPVVCVEASRWGGDTRRHRVGTRVAPSRVRSAARGVTRGTPRSPMNTRQGAVWNEVDGYQARHNTSSPTRNLVDVDQHVEDNQTRPLPVRALPGQTGVIVAAMGQPIALELFDHPDTLAERLESILRGLLLDVSGIPYVETPSRRARRFATRVTEAGLREDSRDNRTRVLTSPDSPLVATDAVGLDESLLHLSALNPRHELVLAA